MNQLSPALPLPDNTAPTAMEMSGSGKTTPPPQVILLQNDAGLAVEVLPFGAYIKAIRFYGQNLTLSYPTAAEYLKDSCYLGATVGRYANRIRHGRFLLGQQWVQLDLNANGHCLHGGFGDKGALQQQQWQVLQQAPDLVQLYHFSPDGSCGFPGNLQIWYCIQLVGHQLQCSYRALSDKDTVLSLTNHCYFNLNNDGSSIHNHLLQSSASHYLPVDGQTLPTGDISTVAGTVFDFQQATALAPLLQKNDAALTDTAGFDHCLVWPDEVPAPATDLATTTATPPWRATLFSPQSGIQLQVFSNKTGLQLYSGQFLPAPFTALQGLCLEAQHWPDAPNHSHFPSALLKAGQLYQHQLCYQFSALDIN